MASKEPFHINESDINLGGLIGTGSSGEVFRATWKNKEEVAVKVFKKITDNHLQQEIQFLNTLKLNHPNVIKYHGHITTDTGNWLIMEYAAKGSLYDYLKTVRSAGEKLPRDLKIKWEIEVGESIQYLQEKGVFHGDIKSPNYVITSQDILKLCDFGIARELTRSKTTDSTKGTTKWQAPEVYMEGKISPKSNIFAMGIIIWELETCMVPYDETPPGRIMWNVGMESKRLPIPEDVPQRITKLIEMCWDMDRTKRPDIKIALAQLKLYKEAPDTQLCIEFGCLREHHLCLEHRSSNDRIPDEIHARGLVALNAYKEALQSGKKAVYRTRLVFIGQERVGKTSLTKRLIGKGFDPHESITDSIEASNSFHVSVEQVRNWNVDVFQDHVQALAERLANDLRTLDTTTNVNGEQDRLTETTSKDILPNQKMYEVTQQNTNPQPIQQNERMREVMHGVTKVETVTNPSIGDTTNEETTREETIPPKMHESVLEKLHKLPAVDVQREMELSLWDFAGQELYYETHQVFLSKRSVVLIVFNLAETITHQQDIQWLRDLDFWMHSIYTFTTEGHEKYHSTQDQLSPPMILVGTHRNQLGSSPDEREQLIKHTFETIEESLEGKCYRKHVVHDKFAVENSEDNNNGIEELQAKITSVATNEPYMGEVIPLRWLKFEENVKSAVKQGNHFLPIREIKNMDGAREVQFPELSTMLQFYHDLGIIMYYPKATSSLRDIIILDPQWLIDVLKSIVTVLDIDSQRAVDKDAWKRLENEGVLEDSLINHMWRDFLGNGIHMKDALLELMEKYDLLVKQRPQNIDESPSCYYVPLRLQIESDVTQEERPGCTVFYVDFLSFLPTGIFYRLMVRAVEWSQQHYDAVQTPILSRTKSSFVADDYHQFELLRTGNMIMVTVVPEQLFGEETRDNANPATTTKVKSFLEDALSDLKTTVDLRIVYRFAFRCPCDKRDEHYLDLDKCLDMLDDTSASILCSKKNRIAKRVIRNKFYYGMNTVKLSDREHPQHATDREHPQYCYRMCHTPRGLCCIINNVDFSLARQNGINMSDRRGSENDAGALETTFSRLHFVVDVKTNLTAPEMFRYLQRQANIHDDIQVDCFVCGILTHGDNQDMLYGVDGGALNLLDATSIFKSKQCPGLLGKPKLFFIQASRGAKLLRGTCHVTSQKISELRGGACQEDMFHMPGIIMQGKSTLPNEADFLLGFATVSGFASFRDTKKGSWYIQTLTAMINQHSSSLEFLEILIRVNDKVSGKEGGREKYKQIPEYLSTLRYSLYFV